MDKSYKCFFCKFDTGPAMEPKENCTDCKFGCNFELRDMTDQTSMKVWDKHLELDMLFKDANLELLNHQREWAHRVLVNHPCYYIYPPRYASHDLRLLRQLFMEVLCAKSENTKKGERR